MYVGNSKELSDLDSFVCNHFEKHDQSGSKALKLVESYTLKLTDMLHECLGCCGRPRLLK